MDVKIIGEIKKKNCPFSKYLFAGFLQDWLRIKIVSLDEYLSHTLKKMTRSENKAAQKIKEINYEANSQN